MFKNTDSKLHEIHELFTLFLTNTPKPINRALDFADSLALRTRYIKDFIIQNSQKPQITGIYNTFKGHLYKDLEFGEFADSFAQTLTYSLFLAKLNNDTQKEIDLYNVKKFIPKSFPLIRSMSGFLENLDELDSIKWLIGEILYIINHINIAEIIKDLNKISEKNLFGETLYKDPYLHFYETFLSKYDPRLRELRGVYYTPQAVVDFIINAIDFVLKNDFNFKAGLGEAARTDNITLLDFATGTGTFLLESFRKALKSTTANSPKCHDSIKNLIAQFKGFEFLIAPYTIAHLKLSQVLKDEFSYEIDSNERLAIFLTNTLQNIDLEDLGGTLDIFQELVLESKQAQETKDSPILIITGNPPYSGASGNKGMFEDEIKITYGLEPQLAELTDSEKKEIRKYFTKQESASKSTFKSIFERKKLQNEKNTKWLLDDYVKFIRFAESKIEKQGSGIFAFISNNSFLDNPTFRGMRYHLLNTFDKIYILDLHGNARKKEVAQDGSKDDNVFDIMQGVSINIFIKSQSSGLAKIYHYDLFGKRKDKYNFLAQNSLDSISWSELKPQEPFYLFIPQDNELKIEYDKGWSVKDIFMVSGVGICSKRDKIVFQDSKEKLKELLQNFITKPKEELYRIYNIGEDSRDWKLESAIECIKENKDNLDDFIMQIHYRPFDMRWTYYINKSRAFMAYPVYEVMQHFLHSHCEAEAEAIQKDSTMDCHDSTNAESRNDNVGLVYDRGSKLAQIDNIFITQNIIDLHLVGSGSYVSPLYLFNKDSKIENFTPKFREFIDSKYTEKFTAEQILGYIYAVLFHKDYREKYLDFLKIDFPKIVFVESRATFETLSKLGTELYKTHLLKELEDSNIGEPLYKDMKDKNNVIEKITYDKSQKRLFVNPSLYFDSVESSVWEYKIGGYAVLDKYLKSHKGEVIDHTHFENVIKTLHKSLELESKIAKISLD